MAMHLDAAVEIQSRLWHWLKDQIVCEVPKTIEVCEYGCSRGQCGGGEQWTTCELRLEALRKKQAT